MVPSPPDRKVALTEDTLGGFLAAFYGKVRHDSLLGPVFASRIAEADWPTHLATIEDFWSSVLFRTGRYKGNPFGKHLGISGIDTGHFGRWLALFDETAADMFEISDAQELSARAHRIGASLKAGLFFIPKVIAGVPS